jgi:hypothetical protein
MKGDGKQKNVYLPSAEKSFLLSGCFSCSNLEMLMELDIMEKSLLNCP